MTAKITTDPLTENYQQAGLRVYQDDDNWASIHMIYAGTGRDFEFIYENNGNPRNEAADKLGGIPADAPLTYWVKLIRTGSELRAQYSYDGDAVHERRPRRGHLRLVGPAGRPGGAVRPGGDATRSRTSTGSASTRIRRAAAAAAAVAAVPPSPTSSTARRSAAAGTSSVRTRR